MAIPATIPDGWIDPNGYNIPTGRVDTVDRVSYVNTIPVSYQANITANGVVKENRGIALNSGPRSYFEHTIQSSGTTVEKLILT